MYVENRQFVDTKCNGVEIWYVFDRSELNYQ